MRQYASFIVAVFVLLAIVIVSGAIYIVDETQQVVITQFGEPMGETISKAGLYFKIPVIQKANYFDKRLLQWDGDPDQVPTLEKQYIWVDATARWRIVDALKFMQSVGSEQMARSRLDDVIEAATRDTISSLNLVETVRNTNHLIQRRDELAKSGTIDVREWTDIQPIEVGREELTRRILKRASETVPNYGIELVDVRIKRTNYIQADRRSVYERMISERKQAAERHRSQGQGERARIEGQMTKELEEIRSKAYRSAQEIIGKADAEAIKIYARAYNKDPEFYAFLKTLETYRAAINDSSTLILSTDSELFHYLKSSQGGAGSVK